MSEKYLQDNPEILEKILENWNLEETASAEFCLPTRHIIRRHFHISGLQ
jgi:hypothetical protein